MWTYNQKTGELIGQDGHRIVGYAGHDEGRNNPAMQNVAGIGPLPCGFYTICAPHDSDTVGVYAMNLEPDAGNEMFGRREFRLHGDKKNAPPGHASHGCIVAARNDREHVWNSGDHRLQVISGE